MHCWFVKKIGSWLPTNFHTMEVSKRLEVDFQQISIPWKCPKGWKLTSNKFPYHGSVQKVGSWLPTNFHTMEVSKRLEVDFQQISIPWKCPKGWKLTSNKFPYHGSVQKVGSWLPTNFHTMEVSKRLEVDFQQISIPWKCPKGWKLTSNKFPYHGSVQKVGSWLWTLPWYGNLLEVNFQPFGPFHLMEICWKSTSNLLDTSMIWKFVRSQLPTFWTLPWHGHFFRNIMEICWKSTQFFQWTRLVLKYKKWQTNLEGSCFRVSKLPAIRFCSSSVFLYLYIYSEQNKVF